MATALRLRLSDDPALVRTSFTSWHAILGVCADQIGSALQIAGTNVRFRRINEMASNASDGHVAEFTLRALIGMKAGRVRVTRTRKTTRRP